MHIAEAGGGICVEELLEDFWRCPGRIEAPATFTGHCGRREERAQLAGSAKAGGCGCAGRRFHHDLTRAGTTSVHTSRHPPRVLLPGIVL
jgi:hypothetical protein